MSPEGIMPGLEEISNQPETDLEQEVSAPEQNGRNFLQTMREKLGNISTQEIMSWIGVLTSLGLLLGGVGELSWASRINDPEFRFGMNVEAVGMMITSLPVAYAALKAGAERDRSNSERT